jgi:hypothetical protein
MGLIFCKGSRKLVVPAKMTHQDLVLTFLDLSSNGAATPCFKNGEIPFAQSFAPRIIRPFHEMSLLHPNL